MPSTTRLGIAYPTDTDLITNGDEAIQAVAEAFDEQGAVYLIDTLANRPAASAVEARIYIATDVAAVFVSDGTDWLLVSANNSVYRTLLTAVQVHGVDRAAGTYPLANGLSSNAASGSDVTGNSAPPAIYFDDADFAVGSLTQKLRVRAQVGVNGTAPGITYTFGLYPVTYGGSADGFTVTLGTVVTGSTIAIVTPGNNALAQGNSGDFTIPSDGQFMLGVVSSGTLANNSAVHLYAQLQSRSV